MTYKLTNRFTHEVKVFDSWNDLDKENLDIRTWGRPVVVSDTPIKPLMVISKVYINPTLWRKDVPIYAWEDFAGVYMNNTCYHHMTPYQEVI